MAKTEITINIPMEDVYQMLKEKHNVDDTAECLHVIREVPVEGSYRNETRSELVSLQLKYTT